MIRYYCRNSDEEEEFPFTCVQLFPVWRGDIAIINVINVDIDVRSCWIIVYIYYLLCRIRRCIVWNEKSDIFFKNSFIAVANNENYLRLSSFYNPRPQYKEK